MKVLVTGASGMLARALVPVLRGEGHEVLPLDRTHLDVTDAAAVESRVVADHPDVVVQCAAFTDVDGAETDAAGAFRLNDDAARHVALACQRIGSLFVYPSTDYVFSGRGTRPYRPDDALSPVNTYGKSKLAGEVAARAANRFLIVRTGWLYGAGGRNFVDTMLRLAGEREVLEVVDDQWGRPTWTGSLSRIIARLLKVGAEGTFHATNAGVPVTWCGFAREIVGRRHPSVAVRPVASAAYPRAAARPTYSVLDCSQTEALLGAPLPGWRDALTEYLDGSAGRCA